MQAVYVGKPRKTPNQTACRSGLQVCKQAGKQGKAAGSAQGPNTPAGKRTNPCQFSGKEGESRRNVECCAMQTSTHMHHAASTQRTSHAACASVVHCLEGLLGSRACIGTACMAGAPQHPSTHTCLPTVETWRAPCHACMHVGVVMHPCWDVPSWQQWHPATTPMLPLQYKPWCMWTM